MVLGTKRICAVRSLSRCLEQLILVVVVAVVVVVVVGWWWW